MIIGHSETPAAFLARQRAAAAAAAKVDNPAAELTIDDVKAMEPADVDRAVSMGRLAGLGIGRRRIR